MAIFGVVTGVRIWSGSANRRCLAREYLKVRYAGQCIRAGFLFVVSVLAASVQEMIGSILVLVICESIAFGIWSSYFTKSKRVQNTYGEEVAIRGLQ